MSYDELRRCITLPANADLSANQYRFVGINTSGNAVLAGNGAKSLGVLYNKPNAAGLASQIAIEGIVKVSAGAAITLGADVASDANGQAKTSATGNQILGIALEAAGAANQVIAVLLQNRGLTP